MTSHEIFVKSPELYVERQTTKFRDVDGRFVPRRRELRAALLDIMGPYSEFHEEDSETAFGVWQWPRSPPSRNGRTEKQSTAS